MTKANKRTRHLPPAGAKDPATAIGTVVLDQMLKMAAPIWYEDGEGDVQNATCTLIQLGNRPLGITCHHVIAPWGQRRLLLAGEEIHADMVIDACPNADLAVFDLSRQGKDMRKAGRVFHEPVRWPPGEVTSDDVIAVCGFPGKWKDVDYGRRHLDYYAFGHGMTGVDAVSRTHIATQLKLSECTFMLDRGQPDTDLGGMSGGPVFAYRELHMELVGFVYEDQRNLDVMRIRRSWFIDSTGRILAEPPAGSG